MGSISISLLHIEVQRRKIARISSGLWGVWESICKYRVCSVVCTTEPVLIESLVQPDHFKKNYHEIKNRQVLLFIFNGSRPGESKLPQKKIYSVCLFKCSVHVRVQVFF